LNAPRDIANFVEGRRLSLARDGYSLVRCELAVFKPEV
jgi:hypothetical protein